MEFDQLSNRVIGCALEVHRILGPGLLESTYEHYPQKASLYEAFLPDEAKRIADKLEIHYTPKHGSWLNMAEIEISVLDRQCLAERMESVGRLEKEATAWAENRNAKSGKVDWRFTTTDARIKLKKLYPSIEV